MNQPNENSNTSNGKLPPGQLASSIFYFLWIYLTLGIPILLFIWLRTTPLSLDYGIFLIPLMLLIYYFPYGVIIIQIIMFFLRARYHYRKPNLLIFPIVFLLIALTSYIQLSNYYRTKHETEVKNQNSTRECLAKESAASAALQSNNIKRTENSVQYNDGEISLELPADFKVSEEKISYTKEEINPKNKPYFSGYYERKRVVVYNESYKFTFRWNSNFHSGTRPWDDNKNYQVTDMNNVFIAKRISARSNYLAFGNLFVSLSPNIMDRNNYLSISWEGNCVLIDRVWKQEEFEKILNDLIASFKIEGAQ